MRLVNPLSTAVLTVHIMMLPTYVMAQDAPAASARMATPSSIQSEHKELHTRLAKAIGSGGRTGAAAKEVQSLLAPHFRKEEEYAMPPLALLPEVAAGKVPADRADVIAMSERLKRGMPEMMREHKAIGAALQRLRQAALDERKQDAAEFADALMAHATEEEQILYPSAILVGEYLKLKR